MVSGGDGAVRRRPARVGLTGGIGAGKSTAGAMFAAFGVPVLDLDAAGRALLAEDAALRAGLVAAFGEGILDGRGNIDRRRLAAAAFASDEGTRRLNAIMHPRIWAAMEAWLDALPDGAYALIEASALIESGGVERMDAVVVVLADRETRVLRAQSRDGRTRGEIERIMARQADDATRRRVADFVIANDGSLADLRRQVEAVHRALLARFGGTEA